MTAYILGIPNFIDIWNEIDMQYLSTWVLQDDIWKECILKHERDHPSEVISGTWLNWFYISVNLLQIAPHSEINAFILQRVYDSRFSQIDL